MWSIQDPHDPWAFRDTWIGEIRNSYDDLWIVIPIVVILVLLAILVLTPLLIHRYCRTLCWNESWCSWFESVLFVMQQVGREKEDARRERRTRRDLEASFNNPLDEIVVTSPGSAQGSGHPSRGRIAGKYRPRSCSRSRGEPPMIEIPLDDLDRRKGETQWEQRRRRDSERHHPRFSAAHRHIPIPQRNSGHLDRHQLGYSTRAQRSSRSRSNIRRHSPEVPKIDLRKV